MSGFLHAWVMGIFRVSLIAALALTITPKGRVRNVLRLLCGTAMALALISPLVGFDFEDYSLNMAQYRLLRQEAEKNSAEAADSLSRVVIERECAAYILDKAQAMELEITSASVSMKWGDDGCWYPYETTITVPGGERLAGLSAAITAELGVPEERQYWSDG